MESSRQRTNFYSDVHSDYFVIYTCEELANLLNISLSTVRCVLKQCIQNEQLARLKKDITDITENDHQNKNKYIMNNKYAYEHIN